MKRVKTILLSLILFQDYIYGQGCLPDGMTFLYQTEIDNFSYWYPNWSERKKLIVQ